MQPPRTLDLLSGGTDDMNVFMTDIPILFNKRIEDLRHIGALGGRAYGRNCRARRRAAMQAEPVVVWRPVTVTEETTAQAIAKLEVQFPWLRGVE